MHSTQPTVTTSNGRRVFACSPAAVVVFIVNEQEEFLVLHNPRRRQWEVVSGALEAGETVLNGVLRETAEECGPIQVRPLGAVHIATFHYDESARYMLSLNYLLAYEGGQIVPGDDMAGAEFRWWPLETVLDPAVPIMIPPQRWYFSRALELFRLWRSQEVNLQPPLSPS